MAETGKNIYFASDFHLGMHPETESREREKRIVQWLRSIESNMQELWLLGDIFDYWFEYKKVVPRGFTRFIGTLADLSDRGIKIHLFSGNHDVWLYDYFPREIGAQIHHHPLITEMGGKTFYLSHGDGLTRKDRGYLLLKSIFRSRFLQWCYARIHPNGSAAFAQWWSKKSRYSKQLSYPFKGVEKEEQVVFAKETLKKDSEIDLFLFGHRHMPFDVEIAPGKRVICLGDWIWHSTYGVFDGEKFSLEKYTPETGSNSK
ncbi:MAG: UDP-2,3-diacylglucosamine diphosphatase [Bacteroidales bacterium]